MLHKNKEEFSKVLERASAQTGFPLRLLEKDYYLTIILSRVNKNLSNDLILKGGTCLNKIYYSYYRLSEDLDFSLKLPRENTTRLMRRKMIKPIKELIRSFAKSLDMGVKDENKAGHNKSTQYIYYLNYPSIVLNKKESIKMEISLRFNPVLPAEHHKVNHKFLHPFTGKPLFSFGRVRCIALKELAAEKMRAAATRIAIAPRDFYDLGCFLKRRFDFNDKEFLILFKKKLEEDGFSSDLRKYNCNLSRTNEEISNMESRLQDELFSVLSIKERTAFNLQNILNNFNAIFNNIIKTN